MKRGDLVIKRGERYIVNHTADSMGIGSVSLVREGSLAHMICFQPSDLRSHEPPRTEPGELEQDPPASHDES